MNTQIEFITYSILCSLIISLALNYLAGATNPEQNLLTTMGNLITVSKADVDSNFLSSSSTVIAWDPISSGVGGAWGLGLLKLLVTTAFGMVTLPVITMLFPLPFSLATIPIVVWYITLISHILKVLTPGRVET